MATAAENAPKGMLQCHFFKLKVVEMQLCSFDRKSIQQTRAAEQVGLVGLVGLAPHRFSTWWGIAPPHFKTRYNRKAKRVR